MVDAYQQGKQLLLAWLPLTRDGFHIYIGVTCLLLSWLLLRLPPGSFKALLLGLGVSLTMELLDLQANAGLSTRLRGLGAARDLLHTNLVPFLIVLAVRLRQRRSGR